MNRFARYMTTALTASLLATTLTAPVDAGWAEDALALQEHLDVDQPFHRTFWVGTHNSYNSYNWEESIYGFDPNQHYTPTEQLDMGVRELTYDIHKSTTWWGSTSLYMCHGLCSGFKTERKFYEGLTAIRDWLTDGNTDSVILLKLEVEDGGVWSQIGDQLENYLGDYIYKPWNGYIDYDHTSDSCHGLEPQYLSKAQVLDYGKNVVVITTRSEGCVNNDSFQEWVHIGFEYEDDGAAVFEPKFTSIDDSTCASDTAWDDERMTRRFDGNTYFDNYLGSFYQGEQQITEDNVDTYLECGLNVAEVFNLGDKRAAAFDSTDYNALETEDLVWSWQENQPNGGTIQNCGMTNRGTGRYFDMDCAINARFACYSELDDAWAVTDTKLPWSDGPATCQLEFGGGYVFTVPHSPRELADFQQVLEDNDTPSNDGIWINYSDLIVDGVWLPDTEELTVEHWSNFGGSSGSAFDDFTDGLAAGFTRSVSVITIKAGARVDAIEVIYNDDTRVHHGGHGGSWTNTLSLYNDDWITEVEICVDRHNGSDRVFYLRLRTFGGQEIAGGTYSPGGCYELKAPSGKIMAFSGRAGSELDALGFYYLGSLE